MRSVRTLREFCATVFCAALLMAVHFSANAAVDAVQQSEPNKVPEIGNEFVPEGFNVIVALADNVSATLPGNAIIRKPKIDSEFPAETRFSTEKGNFLGILYRTDMQKAEIRYMVILLGDSLSTKDAYDILQNSLNKFLNSHPDYKLALLNKDAPWYMRMANRFILTVSNFVNRGEKRVSESFKEEREVASSHKPSVFEQPQEQTTSLEEERGRGSMILDDRLPFSEQQTALAPPVSEEGRGPSAPAGTIQEEGRGIPSRPEEKIADERIIVDRERPAGGSGHTESTQRDRGITGPLALSIPEAGLEKEAGTGSTGAEQTLARGPGVLEFGSCPICYRYVDVGDPGIPGARELVMYNGTVLDPTSAVPDTQAYRCVYDADLCPDPSIGANPPTEVAILVPPTDGSNEQDNIAISKPPTDGKDKQDKRDGDLRKKTDQGGNGTETKKEDTGNGNKITTREETNKRDQEKRKDTGNNNITTIISLRENGDEKTPTIVGRDIASLTKEGGSQQSIGISSLKGDTTPSISGIGGADHQQPTMGIGLQTVSTTEQKSTLSVSSGSSPMENILSTAAMTSISTSRDTAVQANKYTGSQGISTSTTTNQQNNVQPGGNNTP